MTRRGLIGLALVAILVPVPYSTCRAQEAAAKTAAADDEAVIEVDPVGLPLNYAGTRAGGVFVWWEDGVWHLRRRSRDDDTAHRLDGTIKLDGGKFTKVFNYQGMERPRKKGRQVADLGLLNPARDTITFRFTTKGHEDGFDFTVSEASRTITFGLRIDGFERPERIRVGSSGNSPPRATFAVPAMPKK